MKRKSSPPGAARLDSDRTHTLADGDRRTAVVPLGRSLTPGTVLAGRYRVATELGHGGRGVVYRAEDLRLGQPVALKLLPAELARDPARQRLLLREVRIGREVTHPAVCRVHDVVEAEGELFLTMELVEGEDLASLLRRVGRLPGETALRLLRDVTAGLAAAHERGVLHRDLKPANVLVDSRGRARILDFGLASFHRPSEQRTALEGTPLYMAPELLRGEPPTPASDLFAVGLLAWEMLVGERLTTGATLDEIRARQETLVVPPLGPGSGVPAEVEDALRSCLALDPADRPSTAGELLTACRWGDPLAEAVATGETPSPELVAAAAERGALAPGHAWAALAVALALVAVASTLERHTTLAGRLALPTSPTVLAATAREILRDAGWPSSPGGDAASWWSRDDSLLAWLAATDRSPRRWARLDELPGSALVFQHRVSPAPLVAKRQGGQYRVTTDDPPPSVPGMAAVTLDPEGRLLRLAAVPTRDAEASRRRDVQWESLFARADLEPARFEPATPERPPPAGADELRAWIGRSDGGVALRVEGAAWRGRPVWFELVPPWAGSGRAAAPGLPLAARIAVGTTIALLVVIPIGVSLLARRHLRRGQGDRRGAARLFVGGFVLILVARLARADHPGTLVEEWRLLSHTVAEVTFWAFMLTVGYLAVEPIARRHWPRLFIAWQRLLEGRLRDPMIGRDVLLGFAAGGGIAVLWHMTALAPAWLGLPPSPPLQPAETALAAPRHVLYFLVWNGFEALGRSIGAFALMVLAQGLFGRRRPAVLAVLLGIAATTAGDVTGVFPFPLLYALGAAAVGVLVLLRLGLLALTALAWLLLTLQRLPLTWDTAAWTFPRSAVVLLLVATLAVGAFRTSLAGRPALGAWRFRL